MFLFIYLLPALNYKPEATVPHTYTKPYSNEDTHMIFLLVFRYEHKAKMRKKAQRDFKGISAVET